MVNRLLRILGILSVLLVILMLGLGGGVLFDRAVLSAVIPSGAISASAATR